MDDLLFMKTTRDTINTSLGTLNCGCDNIGGCGYWSSSFSYHNHNNPNKPFSSAKGYNLTESTIFDLTQETFKINNIEYNLTARAVRKCYYKDSTTGDNRYEYE